ncbi:TAT-variant-translocated molybdopterin oxidoreductase [Mucisphaera calidilacus]|uniref:Tetrathionate reductase subunit B n=1 Tax=Mucisphaera calidilacus TaxID=2527982 RepID=A0A518C0D5_9BACT|nr:TAT-variant-translocated molybdopterin oxidoreductase [Mucisphaera calidilacus]QDU72691.1 Tetrathionate reductase subunit B precursor [Mucisphaera calidilacus]
MPSLDPQVDARDQGMTYWRSLAEYADSDAFRAQVAEEFPGYDPEELRSMSRRGFLRLAGASMALAGLTLSGCRRWPQEYVVPYASRPNGSTPGVPEYFASMIDRQGVARPTLVTSMDGRPTKVDGNPDHAMSLGAADVQTQASTLEMYDPERSRSVLRRDGGEFQVASWEAFDRYAGTSFGPLKGAAGSGIAFLSEATGSPTLLSMRARAIAAYPGATWHTWESTNRDHAIEGLRSAFGEAVRPQYDLSRADVIACFECDLLSDHPGQASNARGWAAGRRRADKDVSGSMSRMYVAESTFTPTGLAADERLPVQVSKQLAILRALAARIGLAGVTESGSLNGSSAWVEALAADLLAHHGRSLVVVGDVLPPEAHHLAALINEKLQCVGATVSYIREPAADQYPCGASIASLAERIESGEVRKLVILGGNPVYDAPASLGFAELLGRVDETVHLSLYVNETSRACLWHLPMAHALECWGDGTAWDGTATVQQPLIEPLYGGKSAIEVLALLLRERPLAGYDLVRRTWTELLSTGEFEKAWRASVHRGFLDQPAQPVSVRVSGEVSSSETKPAPSLEIVIKPSPSLGDGRMANNGWLQELPDSSTKVCWDNPALMHPADARELGVAADGDLVTITAGGASVTIPVFRKQGQARGSVTLYQGYGRTAAGRVGDGVGVDVNPLRAAGDFSAAQVALAGGQHKLAMTSQHHVIGLDDVGKYGLKKRVGDPKDPEDAPYIVKSAPLERYERDPKFVDRSVHGDLRVQLWSPPPIVDDHTTKEATKPKREGGPDAFNDPHAWGMSIDMNTCIGCNACVIACQSENNIPVVGAQQVDMSREMHWLRLDTYYKGDPEGSPEAVVMPMMCTHCENAPCEQVCPVAATVHDTEGLNTMVYNRCIGTRYCSNNCPYKVRRFNYFDYHAKDPRGAAMPWLDIPDNQQAKTIDPIKKMLFNPAVTVRMRGIMEKCTYCTQRIAAAKIKADNEYQQNKRSSPLVQDGEIATACQMACPTEAIVFGNLNDGEARVSKIQANPRAYEVLRELNTRPRTRHLARITNPNPKLAKSAKGKDKQAEHEGAGHG